MVEWGGGSDTNGGREFGAEREGERSEERVEREG